MFFYKELYNKLISHYLFNYFSGYLTTQSDGTYIVSTIIYSTKEETSCDVLIGEEHEMS